MNLHRVSFQRSAGVRRAMAFFFTFLAASCGGGGDGTGGIGPGPTPTGSFAVAGSGALSVPQGASGTVTITVARSGAFTGSISLAVSGLPAGVTGAFNPSTVAAGQTTSTLTLTAGAASPAGTTTVTITGAASGFSNQTASVALTITAPVTTGPFTMGLSATSFLVLPTNHLSRYPVLTVTRNAGFTGAIALTTTGLPATLQLLYTPNNLTAITASTSTFIIDIGGTPPGTYTATIHGVAAGGAGERTTTLQVLVAATSVGNIHWRFCSASTPQYFFAVKDGSGPWTRVMPSVDSIYSFNISSAVGSVATVTDDSGGMRTTIYQYTAAELAARAAAQCALTQNVSSRTANGNFGGVTGFRTSQVGMAWWFGSANGNGAFSLLNLPAGPLDVVAMRNGDISALLEIPVDRAIIRRGVNPASGGTLPVLDFNAAESFAPTTSTWTFNNVNAGEQMSVSQSFITAGGTTGFFSLYPGVDRTQTVRSIYGIPLAQTIAGDLHQVVATINTTGAPASSTTRASRQIVSYARTLGDRTVAFGPAMPAPTVTAVAGLPAGRLRAVGTLPTAYAAGVTFDVTQTSTARFATVHSSGAFLNAAGVYDVQIPDLSGAVGWDTQFAIRAGVATNWWVNGGGPVLDFYDGRYIFNTTRSRWTGAQTGMVVPADGATYLMARAIGTTTP
ncbi:MAG TPA: hypothetical protein VK636_15925 [Gemmatimonadaceae bacterium]|nr:hypothetical protein [Gemmatimonadaceae bacterium]